MPTQILFRDNCYMSCTASDLHLVRWNIKPAAGFVKAFERSRIMQQNVVSPELTCSLSLHTCLHACAYFSWSVFGADTQMSESVFCLYCLPDVVSSIQLSLKVRYHTCFLCRRSAVTIGQGLSWVPLQTFINTIQCLMQQQCAPLCSTISKRYSGGGLSHGQHRIAGTAR